MPAYNAACYIHQSIISVLEQSHTNWELIIVNDGSTDTTSDKVSAFTDSRIHHLKQENKGVSAARNKSLELAKGEYFCMLDADDILPPTSLESRLTLFQQLPALSFVDGMVQVFDATMVELLSSHTQTYYGRVFDQLIALDSRCFFGNTWMFRASAIEGLRFREGMSHAEDLLFYIEAARRGGMYAATNECVLHCRRNTNSAMSNLDGLARGYRQLYEAVKQMPEASLKQKQLLKFKIKKIMTLSYLSKSEYLKALNALVALP
jgi:teichuronic acid biosynthesis glycosyltransferase TuaG